MRGSENCPRTYEDRIGPDQLEPCPCICEAIETSAFGVDQTLNRAEVHADGKGEQRMKSYNSLYRCLSPSTPSDKLAPHRGAGV